MVPKLVSVTCRVIKIFQKVSSLFDLQISPKPMRVKIYFLRRQEQCGILRILIIQIVDNEALRISCIHRTVGELLSVWDAVN